MRIDQMSVLVNGVLIGPIWCVKVYPWTGSGLVRRRMFSRSYIAQHERASAGMIGLGVTIIHCNVFPIPEVLAVSYSSSGADSSCVCFEDCLTHDLDRRSPCGKEFELCLALCWKHL